jgi:hypothetical protein
MSEIRLRIHLNVTTICERGEGLGEGQRPLPSPSHSFWLFRRAHSQDSVASLVDWTVARWYALRSISARGQKGDVARMAKLFVIAGAHSDGNNTVA